MSFYCLGGDAPLDQSPSRPGRQSHLVKRGEDWWHNAYAGPFCHEHLLVWQYRNLLAYNARTEKAISTQSLKTGKKQQKDQDLYDHA